MKDIYRNLLALFPKPFKTEEVRVAYIYDVYNGQGKSFDEMVFSFLLGIPPESLAWALKRVFEWYIGEDSEKPMELNKSSLEV